jgi:hypothetical protein
MQRFKPASKQSTRRGSKPGLKVFRNNKAKASQEQKEYHLAEVGEVEGERVKSKSKSKYKYKYKGIKNEKISNTRKHRESYSTSRDVGETQKSSSIILSRL